MKAFILLSFYIFHVCNAFFVPIATSSSVTRIAKTIKLADSTLVVSRNSTGHPIAFNDFCPHRGASFNNVIIKNDIVTCPYHGFEFETRDGILKNGLGVKSGCSSLKMIECVDKDDLLWACIDNDNEYGPPPSLIQASDPSFRKISGSVTVNCPVEQLIENILCVIHVGFVHSFGNRLNPEPISYEANRVSNTSGIAVFQYGAGSQSMFSGTLDVQNWYRVPCTAGTLVRSGNDVKIVQVSAVQLPNGITKIYWDLYRNWLTLPIMDVVFSTVMKITLNEDKEILESCSFDHGEKFHGKYDTLQLLYRKALKKIINK